MGRPPIGKVAMTGAERVHRYRAKHRKEKPRNEARIVQLETRVARLEARIAELEAERTIGRKRKRRLRG
jgi:cell division protein FtsB